VPEEVDGATVTRDATRSPAPSANSIDVADRICALKDAMPALCVRARLLEQVIGVSLEIGVATVAIPSSLMKIPGRSCLKAPHDLESAWGSVSTPVGGRARASASGLRGQRGP